MGKADNLLSILWLLHARKRMTAEEIAEELEISIRSVYRYIDALCASGVPVIAESGHNGGYRLTDHFRTSPLFFEPVEVKALFHASEFAFRAGYPQGEALKNALSKLKRNVSPKQEQDLSRQVQAFKVVASRRGGPVDPWLRVLEEAIANENTLDVLYHKPDAEDPEWRTVDPYGLAYFAGVWYLAARCHLRNDLRDFRVDRMVDVTKTSEHFERPASFSLETYFANQEMVEEIQTGPFTMVHIQGSVYAVNSICDHWYLQHCVAERTRTEVWLQLNGPAMRAAPKILLTYGPEITVVSPPAVRKTLYNLAISWSEHHT